jgi:hypothetical protein
VAITLTPLIVRVAFLRRIGKSFFASMGVRALIKSALAGTASKWYFAAVLIFKRFASSCVGDGIESKVVIISLNATWLFKGKVPK